MSDHDPTRYGDRFAELYDAVYEGGAQFDTEGAVARLTELAVGGPVLELGVGTGRLALPLAAAGLEVVGVDASSQMLAALAAKPGGGSIEAVQADFGALDLRRRFPLVVLAIGTIFALPDQDAQVDCFASVARHLEPGGCFVVEAWVPDLSPFWRGRDARPLLIAEDRVLFELAEIDPVEQRMRTTRVHASDDGVRLLPANHRYAWPSELDLMARLAGLALEERSADWRRTPFSAHAPGHVSVYRAR